MLTNKKELFPKGIISMSFFLNYCLFSNDCLIKWLINSNVTTNREWTRALSAEEKRRSDNDVEIRNIFLFLFLILLRKNIHRI